MTRQSQLNERIAQLDSRINLKLALRFAEFVLVITCAIAGLMLFAVTRVNPPAAAPPVSISVDKDEVLKKAILSKIREVAGPGDSYWMRKYVALQMQPGPDPQEMIDAEEAFIRATYKDNDYKGPNPRTLMVRVKWLCDWYHSI